MTLMEVMRKKMGFWMAKKTQEKGQWAEHTEEEEEEHKKLFWIRNKMDSQKEHWAKDLKTKFWMAAMEMKGEDLKKKFWMADKMKEHMHSWMERTLVTRKEGVVDTTLLGSIVLSRHLESTCVFLFPMNSNQGFAGHLVDRVFTSSETRCVGRRRLCSHWHLALAFESGLRLQAVGLKSYGTQSSTPPWELRSLGVAHTPRYDQGLLVGIPNPF